MRDYNIAAVMSLLAIAMTFTSCLDNRSALQIERQEGIEEGKRLGFRKGYQEGRADGYENGYRDGEIRGYQNGYSDGLEKGIEKGRTQGYEKGYSDGHAEAYNAAYAKGIAEGKQIVYKALNKLELILKTGTIILLWTAIFTVCYLSINRRARGLL